MEAILEQEITSLSQLDRNKRYSYADYLSWKFKERVQLLKGYLLEMAAPKRVHQSISMVLSNQIYNYLANKPCEVYSAPFDVRFPYNVYDTDEEIDIVVQPDISVICDLSKLDDAGCKGAPDLIVEILSSSNSPSNSKREMREKFSIYQYFGVKEYWMVFPEYKGVEIYVLENEKLVMKSDSLREDNFYSFIFPDLYIDLDKVFADKKI